MNKHKTVSRSEKSVLTWLASAASKDKRVVRPILRVIQRTTINGKNAIVSSDGYRAHIYTGNIREDMPERQIKVGGQIVASVLYGRYPDIEAVIPREFDATIQFNTAELVSALKIAKSIKPNDNRVTIERSYTFNGVECVIASKAVENNIKADTATFLKQTTGDVMFKTAFNVDYLLDALKCMGETTTFFYNKPKKNMFSRYEPQKLVIRDATECFTALIMPAFR